MSPWYEANAFLGRSCHEEGNSFGDLSDEAGADVAEITGGEVDLEPVVDEDKGMAKLLDAGDKEDEEGDDEGGEEDVKHPGDEFGFLLL